MAGQNRTAVALVVLGAVLAGYGLVETQREVGPYLNAGVKDEQRFAAMIAGSYLPAASSMSKDLVLSDCLAVPQSMFARVQPASRQTEFAERCLAIARAVVGDIPTHSAAWLVLAAASADLGDAESLRSGLVASQRTGADVHWIAEQRVAVASRYIDLLDDADKAAYRLDIETLFDSPGGAKVLATRYLANPGEQQILLEVGETVPASMQQRFLDKVRELKAGQGAQ